MSILIEAGIFGHHIPGTRVNAKEKAKRNKKYIQDSDINKSASMVVKKHAANTGGDTEGKAAKQFQGTLDDATKQLNKSTKRKTGLEKTEAKQIDKKLTKKATKLLDKPKYAMKFGSTDGSPDLSAKIEQIKADRVAKNKPKNSKSKTNTPGNFKPKKTREQIQNQLQKISDRKAARDLRLAGAGAGK